MNLKERITELVIEEDSKLRERLEKVRSKVLGTKDLDLIETYFNDLQTFIEKYEISEISKDFRSESGRLNRRFFADLNGANVGRLRGMGIFRKSDSEVRQGVIEEVQYKQKPRIPNYEAGIIYIMPYKRKVLSNLFNVATAEDNAVVWVRKVKINGRVYGPGQFTKFMSIDERFDGKNIEESDVWIA